MISARVIWHLNWLTEIKLYMMNDAICDLGRCPDQYVDLINHEIDQWFSDLEHLRN